MLRAAHLTGLMLMAAALAVPLPAAARTERVDVALVLAVDVSESVDARRYAVQMEGIAAAFEAPEVQATILSGQHRAMLVAVVQWSNRPVLALPWTLLTSVGEVQRLANRVRAMPRADSGFTCMSMALRSIADKVLTQLPVPAEHRVIDVSGDGRDNCNPTEPVDQVRDELVADGVTVNGLPILEGDETDSLEAWYRDHVVGGPRSFLLPALGFDDFERAFRRKFLTEVSNAPCSGCVREALR